MNTTSNLLQTLKDITSSAHVINPLEYGILVPKPVKPNGVEWLNYISASDDSSKKTEKPKGVLIMTKEMRALKVKKFLEKRRGRNRIRKVRYQQRQKAADKKIRYKGRFVNLAEAKELIIKGEQVTANDMTYLKKLFEEYKGEKLMEKYNENVRTNTSSRNTRKFSLSTNTWTNSRTSPLIQTDPNVKLNEKSDGKYEHMDIEIPPALKL